MDANSTRDITKPEGAHNPYKGDGVRSRTQNKKKSQQMTIQQFKEAQVKRNMDARERMRLKKINLQYKEGLAGEGVFLIDTEDVL